MQQSYRLESIRFDIHICICKLLLETLQWIVLQEKKREKSIVCSVSRLPFSIRQETNYTVKLLNYILAGQEFAIRVETWLSIFLLQGYY